MNLLIFRKCFEPSSRLASLMQCIFCKISIETWHDCQTFVYAERSQLIKKIFLSRRHPHIGGFLWKHRQPSILSTSSYDCHCDWGIICHPFVPYWKSQWSNGVLDSEFGFTDFDRWPGDIYGWQQVSSQPWEQCRRNGLEPAHHGRENGRPRPLRGKANLRPHDEQRCLMKTFL